MPLLTQNEPLGVLILTNSKVDYFGEAQLQLLKTIANEVAIVIHNAELYTFINDLATRLGEALGEQREELSKRQAILQSVNEGVIVLDEREQVVLFNPAAEQVLGIPADFALQQPLANLRDYGETEEQLARADLIYTGLQEGLLAEREQGKAHTRMLELPTPPQTIALNFAPVVSSDGVPYGSVAVLRDVTREIEADRAKRDFISSVSHELRTPLTSIKGYVDLLLLGAAGPVSEGQLSFLGVVKNNANRLMELINDILEIGRIDSHKINLTFEQIDVGHVFSDVLQTLRAEVDRKSLVISSDVQEDLPEITADPRRVTQVVLNLVSNAVKYTYAEGRVGLRAFLNPSGMVQVDVEDNGVGISPEQQQHLFRRFYRADNPLRDEAGGTGLGLSIAKSFVELHGGEMWVKSEANKGSVFSFILPVTQPEQIDADEDMDELGQGVQHSILIDSVGSVSAIHLDNRLIHFEVVGRRGQPIIFLHSWLGSWRYWLPTMEHAADRYRTYALDFWGFGESDRHESIFTVSEYVNMLYGFMDHLGLNKVNLAGHGLGGMVAIRAASEQPERFVKIMIVNTPIQGAQVQAVAKPGALSRLLGRSTPTNVWARLISPAQRGLPADPGRDHRRHREPLGKPGPAGAGLDHRDRPAARPGAAGAAAAGRLWRARWHCRWHTRPLSPGRSWAPPAGAQVPPLEPLPFLDQPNVFSRMLLDFLASQGTPVEMKAEWRRRVSQLEYI